MRSLLACMVAGVVPYLPFGALDKPPAPTPPALYSRIGNVSSYCDVGITASGLHTQRGDAGGDYWLPLGSLVEVATLGVVRITDRGVPGIADVDIWSPSCGWSIWWGRRHVRISVLRFGWGN